MEPRPDELAHLRDHLNGKQGREYWDALDRVAEDETFRDWVRREWPSVAEGFLDPVGRRGFLKTMGASMALAGLGACTRQPRETILAYARNPENMIPGKPEFFATSMAMAGGAVGLLVESHMGRPTKVEGNPDHPSSLGAADAIAQASVLGLYDPDRSQVVLNNGRIASMSDFYGALRGALDAQRGKQGAGLRVLTGTVTSPTLARQLRALQAELPGMKWHQWEAVNRDAARAGARAAFGHDVEARYDFSKADVILSLDADFLTTGSGHLVHARDFAARRSRDSSDGINRLYAVEPRMTVTGSRADHRIALRASRVGEFAQALLAELSPDGAPSGAGLATLEPAPGWIAALARDLKRAGSHALVVVGDGQPAEVHALGHRMNATLGSIGTTVELMRPVAEQPVDCGASMRELCDDMNAGEVDVLVMLGGNPLYDAPADLNFGAAFERVPLRVHWGLHEDETSQRCHWHLPAAHYLEAWSDARGHDGTVGIVQPLIAPLYGGVADHEVVSALAGKAGLPAYDVVRDTWREAVGEEGFEAWWRQTLHDGVAKGTRFAALRVALKPDGAPTPPAAPSGDGELELVLYPDPTVWDGRYANNGWLQECPKPISLLTWDNAAHVSPATAERLGVKNQDVVRLATDERLLSAPIFVVPGMADDCVALSLGYGRRDGGRILEGAGVDAYGLRSTGNAWIVPGVRVETGFGQRPLATTQDHHSMEGRDLVRVGSVHDGEVHAGHGGGHGGDGGQDDSHGQAGHDETPANGAPVAAGSHDDHGGEHDGAHGNGQGGGHGAHGDTSIYPPHPLDNRTTGEGYAWAMVIDLNSCLGCNACQVACQSENNIPVVGREEVGLGREMHWIRVDRYFEEEDGETRVLNQPVPCMHCENAPCEVVCPVAATVHGPEGLNEMVYNRCVGTRYCSNNCPYKVRRFNFYRYVDDEPSVALQRNPDVTVRARGVMEKCTYCVQRINQARITAKVEDREIVEGEVRTACQATCPAQAIHFGDLNDPESRVSKLRERPDHYGILEELNTKPRTTYLARWTNPNPEIEAL